MPKEAFDFEYPRFDASLALKAHVCHLLFTDEKDGELLSYGLISNIYHSVYAQDKSLRLFNEKGIEIMFIEKIDYFEIIEE